MQAGYPKYLVYVFTAHGTQANTNRTTGLLAGEAPTLHPQSRDSQCLLAGEPRV
jgi:hypothetical protein